MAQGRNRDPRSMKGKLTYYKKILAIAIVGTPHKHVTLCLISTSMARLCSRQFALYVYT